MSGPTASSLENDPIMGSAGNKLAGYRNICNVTLWINVCAAVWILVGMTAYGLRKNKFVSTAGGKMYIACFTTIVLGLPRLLFDCMLFHVAFAQDAPRRWQTYAFLSHALFELAIPPIYLFLWLRQHAINCDPVAQLLSGTHLKVLSWTSLAAMLVGATVLQMLHFFPGFYLSDWANSFNKLPYMINNGGHERFLSLGGCIFCQLGLTLLFVWPVFRTTFRTKRSHKYSSLIRPVFCSLVVVSTDVAVTLMTDITITNVQELALSNIICDGSIIVNAVGIVSTFEGVKEILLPLSCRD